jgi:protein-L-isoaspartate(D-aspartate) O-methyltransferase
MGVVVDNTRKRAQLMHEVQGQAQSYFDGPLHEGLLKAMATLPLMVAVMTEVLLRYAPARGKVLEIGSGSGYQAALLGQFFDKVLSFERLRLLLERARNVLNVQGVENVELVHGNGGSIRDEGFHAVIVTCGVVGDIPSFWTKCLVEGGVLLLPHAQVEGCSMGLFMRSLFLNRLCIVGLCRLLTMKNNEE